MKTETNSMRIVKPEKTDTAGTPQQEKDPEKSKYKPVTPVMLDTVPEDAVFIRSADVCKLQTGWDISLQQRRNHELPGI